MRCGAGSPSCRSGSTPSTSARCSSCCRPPTPAARTARSSTSFRGVNPQGLRGGVVQAADAGRARPTTGSGAITGGRRRVARSGSSTAATTRTCSSSGCIRWCRESVWRAAAVCRDQRLRGVARGGWDDGREALPAHLARRAAGSGSRTGWATPEKRWKFSTADLAERERWDDYQAAFDEALRRCSTAAAPWWGRPGRPQVGPQHRGAAPAGVDAGRHGPAVPAGRGGPGRRGRAPMSRVPA